MPRSTANQLLKRVPRAPARTAPGSGPIASIKDPQLRLIIQSLQSRLGTQDEQLQLLETYALKVGSPVNAYGQRIKNVARPVDPDDAVPLWFLQQQLATQAQMAQQGAEGAGEGPDVFDVPLPNLFDIVAAYAAAHPAQLDNSCLAQGGNWDFMDGVVAALQAADPRVGWCGQRGDPNDPAEDAVCYWGSTAMPPVAGQPGNYVVDIIAKHCPGPGDVATATWSQVASAGAVWLPVRPV